MNAEELAEARSRLYALGGHALRSGWTPDTHDAFAVLGLDLPDPADPAQQDALAASWVAVFSRAAPPYPAVWLGEAGQLGGDVAALAADLWARCGLPAPPDVEPDHVGVALRALAWLVAAEAEARRDGVDPAPILSLQREVLGRLLLPAWVPFASAVQEAGDPRYSALIELLGELLAGHAREIDVVVADLPALPPDPLDDPKTGLRHVAAWLTTPVFAGGWLSSTHIDRIAAAAGVPRGFGSRADMALSLIFAAVDHGTLPQALDAAERALAGWEVRYQAWESLGLPARPWRARVAHTQAVLARLRGAASGDTA